MESVHHEPLRYSSTIRKAGIVSLFVFIVLFGVPALVCIVMGIYWLFIGPWMFSVIFVPVGLLLSLVVYIFYKQIYRNKMGEYRFEINEKGIDEERIDNKNQKSTQNHIAFDDMDKVLVGNYVDNIINVNGPNIFKFGVLIVIIHRDGYFFQRIFKANEFNAWYARFRDKKVPIHYTEYNLKQAFLDKNTYDIDFNQIESIPWNQVDLLPPIEHERVGNPFTMWKDGSIEEQKKVVIRKKTKKADAFVTVILFIYALFTGGVILPGIPLDQDGFYELTDMILLAVYGVNMLLPFFLVYWRSYTKWYMPFIYFIAVTAGNFIAIFGITLFSQLPSLYGTTLFLNGMILVFGWFPALIAMKIGKMIMLLMDKYR